MSQSRSMNLLALLVVALAVAVTQGFCPASTFGRSSSSALYDGPSNMETIEFKIYPDGRVEETVRGVKGNNCHKVTEGINEMLGKVVASEPTEEAYEQELVVESTVTESVTDGSSGSGDSWEGSSSW